MGGTRAVIFKFTQGKLYISLRSDTISRVAIIISRALWHVQFQLQNVVNTAPRSNNFPIRNIICRQSSSQILGLEMIVF